MDKDAKLREQERLQNEANSLVNERLSKQLEDTNEVIDASIQLEKQRLEVVKKILEEESLMHDYALKAVEARKQGLVYDKLGKTELAKRKQIEADLYSTKLDVADLSRRNLEKSKKELSVLEDKLKLEKMSAEFIKKHAAEIEKINVLEAKVSEQRKVSNAIAQQAVAPFKAITGYLKEIPVLGKLLTPMLDSLEDKLTKTFEDKAQSTLFKKLSGDLNKSKQSLSSMLPDGVQLEQVLGESANSSSALSAGMESTAVVS